MPWLPGYARRKGKPILPNSSTSQTDYQMRITLYKAGGTDSPTAIYLWDHVKNDFSDIRFTGPDQITSISYWVESLSTGVSATVWIKIPSIPGTTIPGTSTTTMYIYYDNPLATSDSNATNTFNFYEDFSSNTYRESDWTNTDPGTFSLVSDQLHITNFYNNRGQQTYNNGARIGSIGQNFELQFDAIGVLGAWDPWLLIGLRNSSPLTNSGPGIYVIIRGGGTSGSIHTYYCSSSQALSGGTVGPAAKSSGVNSNRFYYTLRCYSGSATLNVYSDSARTNNVGSSSLSYTAFSPTVFDCPNNVHTDPANNNFYSSADIDNIRIRKYFSPEPTFGTSYTEELNITAIDMTLSSTSCAGPCTVTAGITWQNFSNADITVTPAIIIYPEDTIAYGTVDITIPANGTNSGLVTTPTLSAGSHSICPYPN